MKKSFAFRVLVFAFFVCIFSCDRDNNPLEQCVSESTACGTFEACCTVTNCYYLYNGKKYQCDGIDCSDAATDLANDMCNPSGVAGTPCITKEEILEAMQCINR